MKTYQLVAGIVTAALLTACGNNSGDYEIGRAHV